MVDTQQGDSLEACTAEHKEARGSCDLVGVTEGSLSTAMMMDGLSSRHSWMGKVLVCHYFYQSTNLHSSLIRFQTRLRHGKVDRLDSMLSQN